MKFLTIEDALKYYDLNFDIDSVPIYFYKGTIDPVTGTPITYDEIPFKKAIIRTDKKIPLGVVGSKYRFVPLRDSLASIQSFIDNSSISVSRFYSESNGARVSCCFEVADCSVELEGIVMNAEFALRLSHDGSSKILVSILARSDKGNVYPIGSEYSLAIRHTKNANVKLTALDKVLSKVKAEWLDFEDFMKNGATVPITDEEAKEFIAKNMGISTESKQGEAAVEAVLKRWHSLILPSMRNTIFGLYIATCDWCQEERTVRNTVKRKQSGVSEDNVRLMNLLNNKNIYKTWSGIKTFANMVSVFKV